MFPRGVFVFLCVFVARQECLPQDETIKKLLDLDWHCTAICTVSGGTAEFDLKDKICKCTLDETVDEAQKAKIIKDAQDVGLNLVLNEGFDRQFVKREVDSPSQPEEHFVGQRTPNRIVPPRSGPSMYFPSTTRPTPRRTTPRAITSNRRRTTPRRNNDMQQRLKQIQKRINDRRRSRTRNNVGPRLQLRAGFETSSHPNLMERFKERQKEMQEKRKMRASTPSTVVPNVAAPAPKPDASTPTASPILRASHNPGAATSEKTTSENHHLEIITQDPNLYKDDNKL